MTINLRESGVKFALITEKTPEGVKLSTHCFGVEQFDKIEKAKKVVIKEISKEEHLKLKMNKID